MRNTVVWAALVAATIASWVLGGAHSAAAAVLVIAFFKVRYIGLEFMELRHSAAPLRAAFEVWVLLVGGTVVSLYLAA